MRSSLSLLLLVAIPLIASGQSPLTEGEAVRLALSRTAVKDLTRAALQAAEADVMAASQWPNPVVGYGRERVRGTPGSVEQTLHIAQTFDVSGRRELRRDAAQHRSEAAAAGNAVLRAEVTAEVRRRFYDLLRQQELIRAMTTWTQRFGRIEEIVRKLTRAGEASGYDSRRLARERDAAEARLAALHAARERAQERLAALVGPPGTASLEGRLLPGPPPPLAAALGKVEERADLRALAGRAAGLDLESRAAALARIPDVTVGLGPKHVDTGFAQESGFVVTLSVPLPVFDRGAAGQQRAAAEALGARAEYRLARDRIAGELRGLHRQLERLIAAATEYRRRSITGAPELLRIAEAAYRGGETGVLELLDAYRGALETETAALDLEWEARAAHIEYQLQSGDAGA